MEDLVYNTKQLRLDPTGIRGNKGTLRERIRRLIIFVYLMSGSGLFFPRLSQYFVPLLLFIIYYLVI